MKVEVAVLGSPSLISLMVSVDVKQHERRRTVKRTTSLGQVTLIVFACPLPVLHNT